MGFVSDIDNSGNLRKNVKRLPTHLRVKWVDVAHSITLSGREPRFADLTKCIDQKSRIAASKYGLDLAKEKYDNKGPSNMIRTQHDIVRDKVSTFATNNVYAGENGKHEHNCFCCNGTCRYIENCEKLKTMSLEDRLRLVRKLKLCYNCLKGKHFSKDCRKPKVCTVSDCKHKHHILLHNWVRYTDHAATNISVNCPSTGTVIKNCLGIIPVSARGANGNTCETYALVDDGADKTLCDERLIQMLRTESRRSRFK